MPLGGAKDEHFSYFHRSCQCGLMHLSIVTCILHILKSTSKALFKVPQVPQASQIRFLYDCNFKQRLLEQIETSLIFLQTYRQLVYFSISQMLVFKTKKLRSQLVNQLVGNMFVDRKAKSYLTIFAFLKILMKLQIMIITMYIFNIYVCKGVF